VTRRTKTCNQGSNNKMLSYHYNMCPFQIYTFNIILGTNYNNHSM
ncbi:hypothetical protein KSS87_022496, partial [Heliosperma pusillum]